MGIIIFSSLFAWFFTILDSKKILKGGMALGFIIITIVSMIRYDYGNDYMGYYDDFNDACKYEIEDIIIFNEYIEDSGWSILCNLFEPWGFFVFIACLSCVSNFIYYKFIKENVDRRDYWIAVFIYLFTFDLFVLQLSMIRQGFVIALFVLSYHYLNKRKILLPIIITLISISFHKTALILLPFLFFSRYPFKRIGKTTSVAIVGIFVLSILSSSLINDFLGSLLVLDAFSIYDSKYALEEGNKIGIRMLFEFIPFFVATYYLGSNKTINGPRYLVFLSTISALIYPFTTIIHLISRLGFYFSIFSMATIPITYRGFNNSLVRYLLLLIYFIITIYVYIDRFTNSVYTDSFKEFKTIFSVL